MVICRSNEDCALQVYKLVYILVEYTATFWYSHHIGTMIVSKMKPQYDRRRLPPRVEQSYPQSVGQFQIFCGSVPTATRDRPQHFDSRLESRIPSPLCPLPLAQVAYFSHETLSNIGHELKDLMALWFGSLN